VKDSRTDQLKNGTSDQNEKFISQQIIWSGNNSSFLHTNGFKTIEVLDRSSDTIFGMLMNSSTQEGHVKQAASFGVLFAFLLCLAYYKPWTSFQITQPRCIVILCGWSPLFRVFDCFAYNGKSELLLIHLRTLFAYVTTFSLAFSNTSNSGREDRKITFLPYESEVN
jgi:hypothetical protein